MLERTHPTSNARSSSSSFLAPPTASTSSLSSSQELTNNEIVKVKAEVTLSDSIGESSSSSSSSRTIAGTTMSQLSYSVSLPFYQILLPIWLHTSNPACLLACSTLSLSCPARLSAFAQVSLTFLSIPYSMPYLICSLKSELIRPLL